jgi:hypothetical protein
MVTNPVYQFDGTRITTYYRENQITRSGEESYEGKILSLIMVANCGTNFYFKIKLKKM